MNIDNEFTKIINSDLMKSDQVTRYSGIYQSSPEYLSYHIIDVEMISYQISRILISKYNSKIDLGILLQRALVHDADEPAIGDIQRLVKYSSKELHDNLEELADTTMQNISNSLDGTLYTYLLWKEAKYDDLEGWILRLADILSVSNKVVKEVIYNHNLRFLKVADESSNYLKDLISMLNDKKGKFGSSAVEYLQLVLNDDLVTMNSILSDYTDKMKQFSIVDKITNRLLSNRVLDYSKDDYDEN